MPRVGADHAARPSLAIERHRVIGLVGQPEVRLEPLAQPARPLAQRHGPLAEPEDGGQRRRRIQRGVEISLRLSQRDGRLREVPGGVHDRVLRVLPALVDQAAFCLALVFDEAVAVLVARLLDPAQRGLGRRKQLLAGGQVVGPL